MRSRVSPGAAAALALTLALPVASLAAAPEGAPSGDHVGQGAVRDGEPRVTATLMAERHGDAIRAGVLFEMDEGWHIYWKNPGQTGLATEVSLALEGSTFGDVEWPAPEVFSEAGGFITSYGYSGSVVLEARARRAPDARIGESITAVVDYLACASVCIPGRHELRLPLPVDGEPEPALAGHERPMVEPPDAHGLTVEVDAPVEPVAPGEAFEVALVVRGLPAGSSSGATDTPVRFVPERVAQLSFDDVAVADAADDRVLELTLSGSTSIDVPSGDAVVRGVLQLPVGPSLRHMAVEFVVPRIHTSTPGPENAP